MSNANAAVIVEEYADLQCPACRAAHALVVQPLLKDHGSFIRYEFKHFPLASIHRYAMEAAEAAECAADQGKFWEFIDLAYEKQADLNQDALDAWGAEIRVDQALYERCRTSHIKRDAIQASYDAGVKRGVRGTPTFFVNGQQVESTVEALKAAIEAAAGGPTMPL